MEKIFNHLGEKKRPYTIIVIMLFMLGILGYIGNPPVQNDTTNKVSREQVSQVVYHLLQPLPGQKTVGAGSTFGYLQSLIFFGIGIAIVLAVLMIVIGGVRYMASDAFTDKKEATNQMTMAVWGLIIALGGYLLLKVINPELVTFRFPSETLNIQTRELVVPVLNPSIGSKVEIKNDKEADALKETITPAAKNLIGNDLLVSFQDFGSPFGLTPLQQDDLSVAKRTFVSDCQTKENGQITTSSVGDGKTRITCSKKK